MDPRRLSSHSFSSALLPANWCSCIAENNTVSILAISSMVGILREESIPLNFCGAAGKVNHGANNKTSSNASCICVVIATAHSCSATSGEDLSEDCMSCDNINSVSRCVLASNNETG